MSQENNKRIAKNTIMLYCRMFIMMAIGFYTSRVVLSKLGVIDYGVYNVVGGIVGMLSLLNGSMAGATQRWITISLGEGNIKRLKHVFRVGMSAQALIAFIVLLLTETIGLWFFYNHTVIPSDRQGAAFVVMQLSIATMFLNIINVPFQGAMIAHEKMGVYAFISIVDALMKLLICYVLTITSYDKLIVYAVLLFVTFLLNFILTDLYCYWHFVEARFRFSWDRKIFAEMLSLAFWTISGNLAYVGYSQGVTLLVNNFFGPAMNGAMGVAAQAGNIVNQFGANFQIAMNPQITKLYAVKEYVAMQTLVFRSAKFSYYLLLVLSIPFFFEAELLLSIWLEEVPEHSVNFLRIGLFSSMVVAMRNPLTTSAMANGHLRNYQFVVNGILLMICPVGYLVFKLGGIPESISLVFLVIMSIATLASAFMLKSLTHLEFGRFVKEVVLEVLKVTLLAFVVPLAIYFMMDEGWCRLIAMTIASVTYTLFVIYRCGLSVNERIFVLSFINKVKTKYAKN